MDIQRIRELRSATPFKPFRLVLRDGRTLSVERPSFLAIAPNGRSLVHASERGGFDFVAVAQVDDAVVDEQRRSGWRESA